MERFFGYSLRVRFGPVQYGNLTHLADLFLTVGVLMMLNDGDGWWSGGVRRS